MNKTQKIILAVSALSIVVAIFMLVAGFAEAAGLFAVAVVGVPATTLNADQNASINREDISESVTQMMPSRTPLDTIIRNVNKSVAATSQKIGYYQASYKPVEDTLDSTVSGTGLSASVPASSYTYNTASNNEMTVIYVKVKNPDMWRTSDTLLMRELTLSGTKGSGQHDAPGTFKEDVMFYVSSKSDSVLALTAVGGMYGKANGSNSNKYVVPDFTSSAKLIRLGQAKSCLQR